LKNKPYVAMKRGLAGEDKELDRLGRLGVSVHYLQTTFLEEVRAAGHTEQSSVYQIENLKGEPGIVRQKGMNRISPVDGTLGAAYVHCLSGEDNVGPAKYMLSWAWRYEKL
jgi:hypothetical protein